MNEITPSNAVTFHTLWERRRSERFKIVHILVITGRGTGQIVNISREGLSFGCLYPHRFPDLWSLDILDAKGSHIKNIRVKKIWERTLGDPDISAKFELEVGVEFIGLTAAQETELDFLLANLDLIDMQAPCLL